MTIRAAADAPRSILDSHRWQVDKECGDLPSEQLARDCARQSPMACMVDARQEQLQYSANVPFGSAYKYRA